MFWRAKSPLDPDDEEWQLECWAWLLEHLGGLTLLRTTALVLPTREFFKPSKATGHAFEQDIFAQVAVYFGIEPDSIKLVPQAPAVDAQVGPFHVVQNVPTAPLGTYSEDESCSTISYDPKLCDTPSALIATFAHELCHARLFRISVPPPGDWDMEEFATDLAVTFFGFGVFNINEASKFRAFSDAATGAQGWSFTGGGYLSPAERAFALAVFIALTNRKPADATNYLEQGPAAYFKKAVKYLQANPDLIERLSE